MKFIILIMLFDLLNIIISYSNNDAIKLIFYKSYPNKITEINLNSKILDLDLSKFTKLKNLILPNNTSLIDEDLKYLKNIHTLNLNITDNGLQ